MIFYSSFRKENAEKLSKMKSELEKKIEQEEKSCQVTLADIKNSNEQKYEEEEKELKKKLEKLNESMNKEMKMMEQEVESYLFVFIRPWPIVFFFLLGLVF